MSITIAQYQFNGPYPSTDVIEDRSGVYAIIDRRNSGYYLIDVGESATVKSRVENHERRDCWRRSSQGSLGVATYYTPNLQQAGRRAVEQAIRGQYNVPCGDR